MLEWLEANQSECGTTKGVACAAARSNVRVKQWLYDKTEAENSDWGMGAAAELGDVDTVNWLNENYEEKESSKAMDAAALHGRFSVVKFLHQHCKVSCTTALAAAVGYRQNIEDRQQLRAVEYLLSNGATLDVVAAMTKAVDEGHFEIALFLSATRELSDVEKERIRSGLSRTWHQVRLWFDDEFRRGGKQ